MIYNGYEIVVSDKAKERCEQLNIEKRIVEGVAIRFASLKEGRYGANHQDHHLFFSVNKSIDKITIEDVECVDYEIQGPRIIKNENDAE